MEAVEHVAPDGDRLAWIDPLDDVGALADIIDEDLAGRLTGLDAATVLPAHADLVVAHVIAVLTRASIRLILLQLLQGLR